MRKCDWNVSIENVGITSSKKFFTAPYSCLLDDCPATAAPTATFAVDDMHMSYKRCWQVDLPIATSSSSSAASIIRCHSQGGSDRRDICLLSLLCLCLYSILATFTFIYIYPKLLFYRLRQYSEPGCKHWR